MRKKIKPRRGLENEGRVIMDGAQCPESEGASPVQVWGRRSHATVRAQSVQRPWGRMCSRIIEADRHWLAQPVLTHRELCATWPPATCWWLEISYRNWQMLKLGLSILYILLTLFFQRALPQHAVGVGGGLTVCTMQVTEASKFWVEPRRDVKPLGFHQPSPVPTWGQDLGPG